MGDEVTVRSTWEAARALGFSQRVRDRKNEMGRRWRTMREMRSSVGEEESQEKIDLWRR